jgi:hypothetical protein
MIRHCCFIPCAAEAHWYLVDGPKPDDYTESCTEHVGALLTGSREGTHVYPIAEEPVS